MPTSSTARALHVKHACSRRHASWKHGMCHSGTSPSKHVCHHMQPQGLQNSFDTARADTKIYGQNSFRIEQDRIDLTNQHTWKPCEAGPWHCQPPAPVAGAGLEPVPHPGPPETVLPPQPAAQKLPAAAEPPAVPAPDITVRQLVNSLPREHDAACQAPVC